MALTAPERETVILMDDSSDTAIVTTYQRPLINALRKNPGATEIDDARMAKLGGAEFRVPAKLVNIRRPRQASARPQADRGEMRERMANARAAKGNRLWKTRLPRRNCRMPWQTSGTFSATTR